MLRKALFLYAAALMVVLSSCGRDAAEDVEAYAAEETPREVTFSILAPVNYANAIRTAARRLATRLAEDGIEFSIELTTFDAWYEAEEQLSRLRVALMAGREVPDLVINANFPVRSFAQSGLLADFYSLIDRSERFSRSDFFENALGAFEMNEGLYLLPLSFGFDHIGVNNSLSDELLSRFSQKDEINMHELIQLYILARQDSEYEKWARIPISNLSSTLTQIYIYAFHFIDFETQTSRLLDSEFIEFLHAMRLAQARREEFTFTVYFTAATGTMRTYDSLVRFAQEVPFMNASEFQDSVLPLLGSSHSYFSDFLFLVDRDGRLILRTDLRFEPFLRGAPTWGSVFVPAGSDNQRFALDFIYEMVTALSTYVSHGRGTPSYLSFGAEAISTPIFQSIALRYYPSVFERLLLLDMGQNPRMHEGSTMDDAWARVAELNARPMTFVDVDFMSSILSEIVTSFLVGASTPEQAAREMHNRITLWLIE